MEHETLSMGNYYHIYNRGNNRCKLFSSPEEYKHFLHLYDKYILPIAETFAWALMGNHFHLLVRIKSNVVYKYSMYELENLKLSSYTKQERKWETMEPDSERAMQHASANTLDDHKTPVPHKHFSHLFNAYSRYLQVRTGRTGNLFERPFKRKIIDNEEYLKTVILYIHNNPVHHAFCSHPLEYPWTSYLSTVSEKPSKLKRDEVIKLFDSKENFRHQHNQELDIEQIENWLEIVPYGADRLVDAARSGEAGAVDFDLSAREAPDNVEMEEATLLDAVKSKDVDRSEERSADNFDFDLSARKAPDNFKIKEDETDTNRACPGLSGSIDAVRSGKNNN